MDISQVALGKVIQKHRKAKHITQKALAEKVGIQTKSISYIERGINYPSTDNLFKLILLLDISIDEFIYGQKQFGSAISISEINGLIEQIPPQRRLVLVEILKTAAAELSKLQ